MSESNILSQAFFDNLWVKNKNDHLSNIALFHDLVKHGGTEYAIKYAIDKYGTKLLSFIAHPSDTIIIRAILHDADIIETIANPNTELKMASINGDPKKYYPIYGHEMTEEQMIIILKRNGASMYGKYGYSIIKYMDHPSERLMWTALKSSPYAIKYMTSPTIAMFEYILDKVSCLDHKILSRCPVFTQRIVDAMMTGYPCLIQYIPQEYYSNELFKIAVIHNSDNIEFIPDAYLTQTLCDLAVVRNKRNLKFIPDRFQTEMMKSMVISIDPTLLNYCTSISNALVNLAFSSEKNVAKKNRLRFVNTYAESDILRIAAAYGNILRSLTPEHLTDIVIKTALKSNGWAIQYVENRTEEYVRIALESEPEAYKYLL